MFVGNFFNMLFFCAVTNHSVYGAFSFARAAVDAIIGYYVSHKFPLKFFAFGFAEMTSDRSDSSPN